MGYRQYVHPDHFDEFGNPNPNKIDILAIKGIRDKQRTYLVNLKNHVRELRVHKNESSENGITNITRINNILHQIADGYHNIRRHYTSFERVDNPTALPQFAQTGDPSTIDEDELEKSTPFQSASCTHSMKPTKLGIEGTRDSVVKKFVRLRVIVHAPGSQKFTIEEFIYSLAQKDDDFVNWKNFTSRGSVFREVIDNLSKCIDAQFPEISKRRQVWSFKNGVFVGKEWIPERGIYDCCFYPYDSKEFRCLDPTIIACKYFDKQFDDFAHIERWQDIPTPFFDSVLSYQKFEPEVKTGRTSWVVVCVMILGNSMGGR